MQRKAAAFAWWHEPDDARVSRPVVCPAKAGMFSRGQTCRGKSQNPVVWIAEVMETETLKRNYPPLFLSGDLRRFQARTPTMTSKGFAPLSRAVSTVVRTSASAWAAHMAR